MKTTRDINVDLSKEKRKLGFITTRTIDASLPTIPKEERKKNTNPMVTTHNVDTLEAAEDKKKRAVVLKQKNKHQKKLDAQLRMARARDARGKLAIEKKKAEKG